MTSWLKSQRFFWNRPYRQRSRVGRFFRAVHQLMCGFVKVALAVAVFVLGPFAWILRDAAYAGESSTGFEAVTRMIQCFNWGLITFTLLVMMIVLVRLDRRSSADQTEQIVRRSPLTPPESPDIPTHDTVNFIEW